MFGSTGGTSAGSTSATRLRSIVALMIALALVAAACSDDGRSGPGAEGGTGFFNQGSTPAEAPSGDPDGTGTSGAIAWERSGSVDRGVLAVPLDHADPDGETIEIALMRRPAADPDRRIGVLLVNPGGPGASGIEFAEQARFVFPPEVLERFDLIGFDPRGVGSSTPVICGDGDLLDRYNAADPAPPTPAAQAQVEAVVRELAEACEQDSGRLLPFITTEASARDMDLIRDALGEDTINYVGFSYGTYLGATYAELFPDRIRAFVLDAGYSRSLSSAEILEGQAVGFERSIETFLEWCRPERCQLAAGGDPSAALDEVLEDIRSSPLPTDDSDGRELTVGLAWTAIIMAMYAPGLWSQLDRGLDQARTRADGSVLLTLADVYNDRAPGAVYGNLAYAFTAYSCMDREPVDADDERATVDRVLEAAPRVGPVFTSVPSACEWWPVESQGRVAPFSAPDAPPMIVIATTGDPATPYEWGVRLADELSSARLLTVEGDAHTAFGSGIGCVDDAVLAYLFELTMPADGVRCSS